MKSNGVVAAVVAVVIVAVIASCTHQNIVRNLAFDPEFLTFNAGEPMRDEEATWHWRVALAPPAERGTEAYVQVDYRCEGCSGAAANWQTYDASDYQLNSNRNELIIAPDPQGDNSLLFRSGQPYPYTLDVMYLVREKDGFIGLLGSGASLLITGGLVVIWIIGALVLSWLAYKIFNSQQRKRWRY